MKWRALPLVGLTAVVSFLLGLVAAGSRPHVRTEGATLPVSDRDVASSRPVAADQGSPPSVATGSFAAVAARLRSAVVNVHAASRSSADHPAPGYPLDASVGTAQSGAGFIIQSSGYILTNNHVITDSDRTTLADRITVTLNDGRALRADVVGVDPAIDVALLHVDAGGPLPAVSIGRSDSLHPGDWVCAIGNPYGYMGSVTVGVVSFIGRQIPGVSIDDLIQTDVPMSLGSSGGPLVNNRGQVVGITMAIVTSTNIGFATPIDQITAELAELRERGRVAHGYLPAGLTTLTPELRAALRVDPDHGAMVEDVTPDRSAERAGVRTYDVITAVDDTPVRNEQELVHEISIRRPGSIAQISLWRDGAERTIPVKLEERPAPLTLRATGFAGVHVAAAPDAGPLGLGVRDLDAGTAKSLPDTMAGVVVTDVDPAGPAQMAGVRRGQIVVEVNRRRVATLAQYGASVGVLHPGDAVALLTYDPVLREYRIASIVTDPHP